MSQETPAAPTTTSPLSGVRNFRDVGGLPTTDGRRIRAGRLFRSGHLAHAEADDVAFLSGLGLSTVFDFRDDADIAMDGSDVALPGVRHVAMPLSDPASGVEFWRMVRHGDITVLREMLGDGRAEARMMGAYRDIIVERTAEHSLLLRTLAEADGLPALLHCAAGKDRAGLSVMVILLALGVEPDAIETDYLASNGEYGRYRLRRGDGRPPLDAEVVELLNPLFEARLEYLRHALATITEVWGGTDRYLTEGLRCDAQRRERLRGLLLDGV
ncbi:protein tyrosine phosphatase [Wenjunlia vitaminophila]|uniref:Protein tyrosine phosphatase n=1 Tax=Wenjunlia vitaminophila TaxID=76728 RepID=A0A0T6LPJ7_WENVI|nr:tyrosine-protein phosphatase [Wenjunlia vitaminophila]KRV48026.1 protein tyrosine phosphatase [Wenjunlia vitaminophila]